MGARLVSATYAHYGHLPDRAFRLLIYMALVCKDETKAPTYYGGREALATALGAAENEAGFHAVKRCIATLVEAGAVSREMQGYHGKRSEYRLHVKTPATERGPVTGPLKGATQPAPSETKGGQSPAPEGGHFVNGKGATSSTKAGHSVAPLGTNKEYRQEDTRNNSSSTEGEYRERRVKSEPKTYPSADDILARAAAKRAAS
jgi:hypothetical protein